MADNIQDLLYESFIEASGVDSRSLQAMVNGAAEVAGSNTAGQNGNALATAAATAAGIYGDSATSAGSDARGGVQTSNGGSGGNTAASIASTFLESGFGMVALVKGLMGLFGGGDTTQQPLEKYAMPSPIDFSSAITSTGMSAVDYDQTGTPRAVSTAAGPSGGGGGTSSTPPAITVNVQAMDAQSFLDHSDAIAQAVRGAMLNMSSINDVVNEL